MPKPRIPDPAYERWLDSIKAGVALDIERWHKAGKSSREITDLLFRNLNIAQGLRLAYDDVPKWLDGEGRR
jgi:hypothetical protein